MNDIKMQELKKKLKFIVLPGSHPNKEMSCFYEKAYQTWHDVWASAYKELGINNTVFSNEFTRQTEIDCVFYNNECAGMLFLTWIDFSYDLYKNDSYFKIWSKSDINKLTKYGPRILVCSNTTVSPIFRRNKLGFSMKDLVFYLNYQRFKYSQADAMTGVMRRERGVHKLGYRYGAVPIREKVEHFNKDDLVDIVGIYKNTVSEGSDPFIIELGRHLFKNKIIVSSQILGLPEIDCDTNKQVA